MTYGAKSANPAVAAADVAGSAVTVRGVGHGFTSITITATDNRGLSATQSFDVTVGRVISFSEAAVSAPEGGAAALTVGINRSRTSATTLAYVLAIDDDPTTHDADGDDHDGVDGIVAIAAGETEAVVEIAIHDDTDIEPAREIFTVTLKASVDDADVFALDAATATVTIEEGVCDRTRQVRDALRGRRTCAAVSDAHLAARRYLRLNNRGIDALRTGDFSDLANLRFLNLADNRLRALPAEVFADLSGLRFLELSENALEALPAGVFEVLAGLELLRLNRNDLAALPAAVFDGLAELTELQLQDNPGAPFPLTLELARIDADVSAPGPATIIARVAEGAPFTMRARISATNGTLSADAIELAAGGTTSASVTVSRINEGATRVTLDAVTQVPETRCGEFGDYPCFRGIATSVGPTLVLFKDPPSVTAPTPHPELGTDGDTVRVRLLGLFAAADGGALTYTAQSSNPALATVTVDGNVLIIASSEDGPEGVVAITVTATDQDGLSGSLTFQATVETMPRGFVRGWRRVLLDEPKKP